MLYVLAAAAPIQPPTSVSRTRPRWMWPLSAWSIDGIAATRRSSMTRGFVSAI